MKPALKEALDEAKKEFNRKEFQARLTGYLGIKCLIISSKRDFISFRPETKEHISRILNSIKPTEYSYEYDYNNERIVVNNAYKLHFNSEIKGSNVEIIYSAKNYDIRIKIPVGLFNEITNNNFLNESERFINDTEYHYFPGYSYGRLKAMKIKTYVWKKEQLSYSGGYKYLINTFEIIKIINILKTN